jgi:hypothetical protein
MFGTKGIVMKQGIKKITTENKTEKDPKFFCSRNPAVIKVSMFILKSESLLSLHRNPAVVN